MAEKTPKTYDVRILLKNATDAQWKVVEESFIPMKGEMVLFEEGKWKVGNGTTVLKDLPFFYGDKDTDTKYEFSVDPEKPATLIIAAKDKAGNQIGEAQELVIPGIASQADLDDLSDKVAELDEAINGVPADEDAGTEAKLGLLDRMDDVEETLEALTSLNPLDFKGVQEVEVAEDGAISVPAITEPKDGDVVVSAEGKEYVYVDGKDGADGEWREFGDENAYVVKEDGKGLSSNDFTDELKEKLEGIDLDNYVEKEDGKGLSANDFTDALKEKLENIDLSNYVEKEEGKGLSTNDLTDEYKAELDNALDKLDGIAEGATKVEISDLLATGQNVATVTINGTAYTIKAPLADEVNVPNYISDLAAAVNPTSDISEVVFSCGGAPQA